MSSKSGIGKGTTFSIKTSGSTFVAVAEITDIKPMSYKMGTTDSTSLDSTNSEVIGTIPDYGEVSLTGKYLPADAGRVALLAAFDGAVHEFKLQLPKLALQTTAGDLYDFMAILTEYTPISDVNATKPLEFSCKMKINALPTLTAGS